MCFSVTFFRFGFARKGERFSWRSLIARRITPAFEAPESSQSSFSFCAVGGSSVMVKRGISQIWLDFAGVDIQFFGDAGRYFHFGTLLIAVSVSDDVLDTAQDQTTQ